MVGLCRLAVRELRTCAWLALICWATQAAANPAVDCKKVSVIMLERSNPTQQPPIVMSALDAHASKLAPHGVITLQIHLSEALAQCFDGVQEPTLYLDHLPMTGLPTTGRYVTKIEKKGKNDKGGEFEKFVTASFRLDKPTKGVAWSELLYRDWISPTERWVDVGIGSGGTEFLTLPKKIRLAIGRGSPSWAGTALVLSLIAILGVALGSRALQDRRDGYQSISLSRLMLSCWVATTTAVVIVVWRHTQALPYFADGGLPFMIAASGLGTGFSTWIDTRRKRENQKPTSILDDLMCDEDGLALHRLQSLIFNMVVLYVVWADLITYGTVAQVDSSWAYLLGASTLTYLFGRGAEGDATAVDPDTTKRPTPILQPAIKNASEAVLAKIKELTGKADNGGQQVN